MLATMISSPQTPLTASALICPSDTMALVLHQPSREELAPIAYAAGVVSVIPYVCDSLLPDGSVARKGLFSTVATATAIGQEDSFYRLAHMTYRRGR